MTERSAERRVRQETGWLAGGPLLRITTTRRTTDTFLFISHTTNLLMFKFRCNIFIGVRIIKEMPGSVASGTPCTSTRSMYIQTYWAQSFVVWANEWCITYFFNHRHVEGTAQTTSFAKQKDLCPASVCNPTAIPHAVCSAVMNKCAIKS